MGRFIVLIVTTALLAGCVYEAPPPPAYAGGYSYPSGYYAAYPGYYYGPPVYGSVFVGGRWR